MALAGSLLIGSSAEDGEAARPGANPTVCDKFTADLVADFKCAQTDAWASQAIRKNDRCWFYASVEHDSSQLKMLVRVRAA